MKLKSDPELDAMKRVEKILDDAEHHKIPVVFISVAVLRALYDRAARPHD
jgi:hypothetical protein